VAALDQVGDAPGDHPRLAAAGARHHEQGPLLVKDRLALGIVQFGQNRIVDDVCAPVKGFTLMTAGG
jgi:hypothetical protein